MASSPLRVSMWAAAGRPALVQSGIDTDDLRIGRASPIGAGPFSEPHPQRFPEVLLQPGVVGFRRGDVGLEEHTAVDRQPASVECLATLFATATRVCRSGSPARESRWVKAVATRPRTLTCRRAAARPRE